MSQETPKKRVHCAIYTRKSTEEGLDREFNSLDAQREAGEAYIKSQQHEGWECLSAQYNDGGYTGANLDRPALQRLLTDVAAGKVDIVVVYKVDRLSRSLLDFGRLMETFDKHGVSFVSVTQAFNTTSSMGRLTLNILLSFAQFEREMISERTRDKMGAARRKGKWAGGMAPLGYDVVDRKLVLNEAEAHQVREIFALYQQRRSPVAVLRELDRRGWTTKRTAKRDGGHKGGRPYTKDRLYYLLRNVAYTGHVAYQGGIYAGEHPAIVDAAVFEEVQAILLRGGHSGGHGPRTKNGGILSGLLRCRSCDAAMSHTFSSRKQRTYRYYTCGRAQKRGHEACTSPSVSAPEIEAFVLEQIREIGRDPQLLAATTEAVREQTVEERHAVEIEEARLAEQIRGLYAELARAASSQTSVDRLADLNARIDSEQQRLGELRRQREQMAQSEIDPDDLAATLAEFLPVWNSLTPREQHRVLELLLERVEFDGAAGEVTLTFNPLGIQLLGEQTVEDLQEDAA